MSACEHVFSIPEMRLIILSYYMDIYPTEKQPNCCKNSLKAKLDDFRRRFFICILARLGIVTPTIFR